ncbi:Cyanobacterial phytochrome B [Apiospora rasikravindrae]|uniref:Cyanobacterial phytochrome B n=1 Tax=Apiospora rasikravindrae TaxID=990691 RepID=A0ABR1SK14_9PEZI
MESSQDPDLTDQQPPREGDDIPAHTESEHTSSPSSTSTSHPTQQSDAPEGQSGGGESNQHAQPPQLPRTDSASSDSNTESATTPMQDDRHDQAAAAQPSSAPPPQQEHPQSEARDFASGQHGLALTGAQVSSEVAGSETDDEGTTPPACNKPTPIFPDTDGPDQAMTLDGSAPPPSSGAPSSWSQSSDHQLGYGSNNSNADPADRVFPIRSVVSVDNSQPTPWSLPRTSGEYDNLDRRSRSSNSHTDADLSGMRRAETAPNPAGEKDRSTSRSAARKDRKNTVSGSSFSVTSPPPVEHPSGHNAGGLPLFNDGSSDTSEMSGPPKCDTATHEVGDTASGGRRSPPGDLNEALFTTRFRHVVTDEGHAILTGRDGTLERCEDEPIHTPGAVQSFGLLVAIKEDNEGRFLVRIVSENSQRVLGYTPQQLFRLDNFVDIFSEEQADNMLDHIDFIRDDDADPATNGPEVFSISIRPPTSRSVKLWCAMHVTPANPDLVICEFELEDDREYPLRGPDEMTPPVPQDTLYQNPTLEEFNESTEISSRPLRVLRSARKKRGEAGAMQVFDIMSQVQEQLATAPNLDKFLKILVGIVKELTGFHRVMVYQFDSAFNGKVVTELVDPTHTRDLYKGLHFPASDIPKQARDLYKVNKVRLLFDRDLESARLVCRTVEDLEQPLDLTHSYLRAMSPIHLKYLKNMAVRGSMSISINAFNELWGLISCHSYGDWGMRVSFPIRKMCRLIGDTTSRNIERLSYASRLQARKLINTAPTDQNPTGYIIASSDDLLKLFDADFGMLSIRGETKVLGKIGQTQEALALLEYLRVRKYTSVVTTQDVKDDLPDLRYPPGFSVIAGMLYVPLSVGGRDFIVFFRRGQIREVKWAGNPYEKVIKEGTSAYLEPRKSFQVWHETVVGKCREWSEEQVETAAVLCLVYGKFIEVWRQKEAALQNSRLTRLLLANSAHEVRTPLNAIINYLEIALEGSLDQETRDNLAKSHSASKSLIYVINDLLDLTKTEEGQELIKDEILDFPACLEEATAPFRTDAKRKNIGYEVVDHPGLPRFVHGDHRRVRQAIANMTANAVQHTSKGHVKVECYVAEVAESRVRIEVAVQDTGRGMSAEQLDALFQDLEQVSVDTEESNPEAEVEKPTEGRGLGLGLAMVARIVRNMDGQLRLKSEEGKGSRFVIQLPFELPSSDMVESSDTATNVPSTRSSIPSVTKSLPPPPAGEVTLVERGSGTSNGTNVPNSLKERRSFDETTSINSLKSGASKASAQSNMSDADRLIDAIQTTLSFGDHESEAGSLDRWDSQGSNNAHRHSSTSLNSMNVPGVSHSERPVLPVRSTTSPTGQVTGPQTTEEGKAYIADTKTPVRPIKVPDEYTEAPTMPQTGESSGVLYEIGDKARPEAQKPPPVEPAKDAQDKLRVLIAEDDPINLRILRKRLEKAGHHVSHAANGEDCASVYSEQPDAFDVILMDMQMPIVDGLTSTKMIRAFEKSEKCQTLSALASYQGRVPIFAVSASLVEKEGPTYINAGFDGWILKPIDIKRLHTLLYGIRDDETRRSCLYVPGEWERGGWFQSRSNAGPDTSSDDSNTPPSGPASTAA